MQEIIKSVLVATNSSCVKISRSDKKRKVLYLFKSCEHRRNKIEKHLGQQEEDLGLTSYDPTVYVNDSKPCQCSRCGLGFKSVSAKKSHEKSHSNVKLFQCAHCPSTFARKNMLTHHENKRHGLKSNKTPHTCKECQATFTKKYSLRLHETSSYTRLNSRV